MHLKKLGVQFGLRSILFMIGIISLAVFSLWPIKGTRAFEPLSANQQEARITPAQLIEAVNDLRISNGLHTLSFHPILMQTAQQQANALRASEGAVGHTRPGGMSYTDQLISLGYPLAGDLSLGGYRSENWIWVHPEMSIDDAIQVWLGDGPHTNTMLSPNYEYIGAGVAFDSDGTGYLVIDTAKPTASGLPQKYTPEVVIPPGTPGVVDLSEYIMPILLSTARPDGDVIHIVQFGQSLWSIAIEYGTKIEQIRLLNNLPDTTVYSGQKLLVMKGATQPPPELSEASRLATTLTPAHRQTSTPTPEKHAQTTIETIVADEVISSETPGATSGFSTVEIVAGVLVLFIIIGGVIIWFYTPQENPDNPEKPAKDI